MKIVKIAFAAAIAAGAAGAGAHALMRPAAAAVEAPAATAPQAFWVEQLADGINMPWSMEWLPNGDLLVVEKHGGIRIFRDGKFLPEPVKGVPAAFQSGQNGLLDLLIDPDFKTNQRVFLSFTEGDAKSSRGAIYRARYVDGAFVDGKVIYRTTPDSHVFPYPVAARLLFLPDKTLLYASTDDHGRRHLAQQLDNGISKILRIDRDGKPAKDNPKFADPKALPEIYAYGVRAPTGLARDPKTGVVWEIENGPRGGDELNVLKPGANYGWPLATYGTEYTGQPITDVREAPGIEGPKVYWVPSIAPSSLMIYSGSKYPAWRDNFFIGALIGQHLRRVRMVDGKAVEQEVMLKELKERIRAVDTGPDGYIYLLTDHPNGRLLRLRPGAPGAADMARVAKPLTGPGMNLAMGMPAPLKPDAARGQQVFMQKCQACHTIAQGAPAQIGPNLFGVVGRKAASVPGFAYSEGMKKADLNWTAQYLDYFLAGPTDYVPGTSMASPPVIDRQERADVIAYMAGAK